MREFSRYIRDARKLAGRAIIVLAFCVAPCVAMAADEVAVTEPKTETQKVYEQAKESLDKGDYTKALEYVQKASDLGLPEAQFLQAQMLAPTKKEEATKLLKKAADQGYAPAQFVLGSFYIEQRLIEEGLELIKKSAEGGYVEAQYNLGDIYRKWQRSRAGFSEMSTKDVLEREKVMILS